MHILKSLPWLLCGKQPVEGQKWKQGYQWGDHYSNLVTDDFGLYWSGNSEVKRSSQNFIYYEQLQLVVWMWTGMERKAIKGDIQMF